MIFVDRRLRIGVAEDVALGLLIVMAACFPALRELAQHLVPALCGAPMVESPAIGWPTLLGKLGCVLVLACGLPLLAGRLVGSWSGVARIALGRAALGAAGIVTAMLTAYDLCTQFHAAQAMSNGCACWLTALVAALAATSAVGVIVSARALVGQARRTIRALVALLARKRHALTVSSIERALVVALKAGISLARACAGRAPPNLDWAR
jgi:hypothetical protein